MRAKRVQCTFCTAINYALQRKCDICGHSIRPHGTSDSTDGFKRPPCRRCLGKIQRQSCMSVALAKNARAQTIRSLENRASRARSRIVYTYIRPRIAYNV